MKKKKKKQLLQNKNLYTLEYSLRFFFVPIAVWPLIYGKYITFTQLGIILSVAFIWQTVLELPSGALADLIGRKKTIVIGFVFRLLGFLSVVFGNSFIWFLAAEVFDKTHEALYSGAAQALAYDSLKEQNKEAEFEKLENKSYFWATTFFIGASVLGGFLYTIHPKLPYIVVLLPATLNILVASLYKEPTIDTQTFSLQTYLKQNVDGFKHIFRHRQVALISFYSVSVTYVFLTGLWWLYQKAGNEIGFAPQYVGILIGGLYAMRSIGSAVYSKLKQTHVDQRLAWLATFQGLFSFLIAIPSSLIGIVGLAGRYLTDGIRQPLVTTAQNKHMESKYRATALSAVSLLTSIALAVTNPFIGWGIDHYGARTVIGVLSVVSFAVALPLAQIIKQNNQKKSTLS